MLHAVAIDFISSPGRPDHATANARALGSWQKGSLAALDIGAAGVQGIACPTDTGSLGRQNLGYDGGATVIYQSATINGVGATSTIAAATTSAEVAYGIVRPTNTAYAPRVHV